MTCENAMITKVATVAPDATVSEALSVLRKHNIRVAPVTDKNGVLVGIFGSRDILEGLLPVSVTMEGGLEGIDFIIGAAPGIAKRLAALKPQTVEAVMRRDFGTVKPDTPIWEAIRLLVKYGSPLPVVEPETRRLMGIISEQSALEQLDEALIRHGKK